MDGAEVIGNAITTIGLEGVNGRCLEAQGTSSMQDHHPGGQRT
jgi:hypothetical protein